MLCLFLAAFPGIFFVRQVALPSTIHFFFPCILIDSEEIVAFYFDYPITHSEVWVIIVYLPIVFIWNCNFWLILEFDIILNKKVVDLELP